MAEVDNYSIVIDFCHIVSKFKISLLCWVVKGKIQAGMDADMILMDQKLNLTYVIAKGQMMMDQGELIVQSSFSA